MQENRGQGPCGCPCLPKCCPTNKILSKNKANHGFECIDSQENELPEVPLNSTIFDQETKPTFFVSGFPTCYGYKQANWMYEVISKEYFKVDADIENEYTLYIQDKHEKNVDRIRFNPSKPFKYFCFDILEDSGTVALTCPKEEPLGIVPKCCPEGEGISDLDKYSCIEDTSNQDWSLSFNGYVHNAKDLLDSSILVHIPNRVPKSSEVISPENVKTMSRKNFPPSTDGTCPGIVTYDHQTDALHIGPDVNLYFPQDDLDPDLASGIDQTANFCIDAYALDDFDYYNYDEEEYDEEFIDETEEVPACQKIIHLKTAQITYCRILWDDQENITTKATQDLPSTSVTQVTTIIQNVTTTTQGVSSVATSTSPTLDKSSANNTDSTFSSKQSASVIMLVDKILLSVLCMLTVLRR